jgi:hypothetical protein
MHGASEAEIARMKPHLVGVAIAERSCQKTPSLELDRAIDPSRSKFRHNPTRGFAEPGALNGNTALRNDGTTKIEFPSSNR